MKKKICFVVSSPITARAFLLNHIKSLDSFYDIYLVANFENQNDDFAGIPLKELKNIGLSRNINLSKDFKALFDLRRYLKSNRFDAVHSVTPKAGFVAMLAARFGGIEKRIHIFTGQVWHTKKGIFKFFLMFLDRLIVCNATHILVDGESQRSFLIKSNIIKNSNSFVLGKGSISGVDTKRFFPDLKMKTIVREELGFRSNEVVFMFLGRMNLDKGLLEFAVAFNELLQKYPTIRLLFVGPDEGNVTPLIKDRIQNLDSVIFYGKTNEPHRLLQACNVFCLPSHREGFGTSILEASLLEKPVICSDTYGLMETIIDDITGLRHIVNNAASLYSQMEKLINNEELRDSLGKRGRMYVLKNFSALTISEKWVEFYKKNI